jgi:hypothetical protein
MYAHSSNDIYSEDTYRRRRYTAIIDPHVSNIVDVHDFRNLVDDSLEINGLIAKALTVIVLSFFSIAFILYYVSNGETVLHSG